MSLEPVPILRNIIEIVLERFHRFEESGALDPEFERTHFINPRYQEACLTLTLAAEHGVAIPEGTTVRELQQVAVLAIDTWLRWQHRSGAVRCHPNGILDTQATAYGAFAVARSLLMLKDRVPPGVAQRAQKGLRKAARYLSNTPVPPGPETRPLRAAALSAVAEYLDSPSVAVTARTTRQEGERLLMDTLSNPAKHPLDAGALALALSYLVLGEGQKFPPNLDLYEKISGRCLLSTTECGLFGGGAESSLACLPILTGFAATADRISTSARIVEELERAWEAGFYSALLDTDVPWLTPMGYLFFYAHLLRPNVLPSSPTMNDVAFPVYENGSGRIRVGDWSLRLGMGGTIGWLHHHPSCSTRLFGSPAGLALREGPWLIEGNRLRHPSMAGRFQVDSGPPWAISGDLFSLPIPGTERSPRRVGFPRLLGKQAAVGTRLAPPPKHASARASAAVPYRREVEIKDGALTIETQVPGKILHRLPMIWAGGLYGEIQVDKQYRLLTQVLEERRVREIVFEGGPWPPWTVRFDRPVDLLYEPIHGLVTSSPMRYVSAAGGTFDILATDRLHMAWRVG